MDIKESLIIVMSTESKIFTGVIASVLTGLLVSLHIVDPSQADTVNGMLQTGGGLLISLIAIAYGLETLLVTHKSEVANIKYTDASIPPVTPPVASPDALQAKPELIVPQTPATVTTV